MINYTKGNAISMFMDGQFDAFAHGCNCFNRMGRGIALEVKRRLPEMYEADRRTIEGSRDKLGTYTHHDYEFGRGINLYSQYTWNDKKDMLKLWAVGDGFEAIFSWMEANHKTNIVIPKIGSGLARGDLSEEKAWTLVSGLIAEVCPEDIIVTVVEYDPHA